jgi:hypothetical protein
MDAAGSSKILVPNYLTTQGKSSTLKMEVTVSSEMLEPTYQAVQCESSTLKKETAALSGMLVQPSSQNGLYL